MGFERLTCKQADLSDYLDSARLTEKQRDCASLKWELGLKGTEMAKRLNLHYSIVQQHFSSAETKIQIARKSDSTRSNIAKTKPGGLD
jgi:DNA-directed RNA polymerase specialized sigma24 family protein